MVTFPITKKAFENATRSGLLRDLTRVTRTSNRGGEWYLEKRGSRNILAGSRNLESVFDNSRSLVFAWFAFYFSGVSGSDFEVGSRRLGESRI